MVAEVPELELVVVPVEVRWEVEVQMMVLEEGLVQMTLLLNSSLVVLCQELQVALRVLQVLK